MTAKLSFAFAYLTLSIIIWARRKNTGEEAKVLDRNRNKEEKNIIRDGHIVLQMKGEDKENIDKKRSIIIIEQSNLNK